MRTIKVGDKELNVRASAVAMLYYKQEFFRELLSDWDTFVDELHKGRVEAVTVFKIVWAMAKAQAKAEGKNDFPAFEPWLEQNDELNALDVYQDVADEVKKKFFRADERERQETAGQA